MEERKLTVSERLLQEIIQTVNSKYTLDDVMCQSTPQGNVHITTRDGKDICTVGREEFTISGDDTILIDELRDNGYWYEDLEELDEEDLIEKEEFDTMAFAQLLPMSYTDFIDNHISDYIEDGAEVEDIIAEYKEGLSEDDLEEFDDNLAQQYIKYKLSEGKEIKTEAKVTDYINEEELDALVKSNPVFVANNYEVLEDMILDVTSDMGHSYYKVIKNDDGSFEAYWIDKKGTRLGDNFILKESKKIEESTDLSVNDNTVIVNKNQYGYNTIAIIIDDTNKRFQLVSGQTLPTGRYKKASKKAIRDKAEILKDKGYEEVKGRFSLAESKETLTEGDYKVSFNGNATVVQGNEEAAKDTLEKVISNVPSSNIKEIEVTAKLEEASTEDIMAGKALSVKDKEIKKLTEGKVTTAKGEFEYEELKAMETEMKDAFKDYWAGNISGADLEAVKSKLGKYLTQGQISNCQYDASREVEKVTEGKEETPEEILDRAIEEEQDAIDTYDELLDGIEDEDLEEVIKEIQKDEEDHKEILQHYDETGEVITDEDLEEKDELLEEELIEDDEYEDMETVIEYTITYMDMTDDEIFDNQEDADARFAELKADGQLGNVRQYFAKAWDFEHGGYVEGDVEVYYNNGDELEESLTEGAENGMTFGEFKTRLQDAYHSVLPDSACTVQLGALDKDSAYITYYLAANSQECPNGIAGNDLFHIGFCVREDKDVYGENTKLEDDTVLPENLVLEVNSSTILTTPDNKYMAYGSEKLPFRKAKGNAEKILQTLEKYASKAKEVTIRLLDEGRIPEDRIEFVSSKVK